MQSQKKWGIRCHKLGNTKNNALLTNGCGNYEENNMDCG
jgi:hypothetical protein